MYTPTGVPKYPFKNPRGIHTALSVLPQRKVDCAVRPYCVLITLVLLLLQGLGQQMLHKSDLPIFETGCVGHPFHPTPAPNKLSIILHKDIGQGV